MRWVIDTLERVIVTFLEAWLAAWLVLSDKDFSNFFSHDVLLIGFVAAIGSFLKCLTALTFTSTGSASLSPKV
jgi:hypothetical protein